MAVVFGTLVLRVIEGFDDLAEGSIVCFSVFERSAIIVGMATEPTAQGLG